MTIDCQTPCFEHICENADKRITVLQGGTSSGKTYAILQFLYILALKSTKPLVISVVAETGPHLMKGAIRDFINIMGEAYHPDIHNKSSNSFNIGKSLIEFFSVDQPEKAHGARRDILFINEANHVPLETYNQLECRTRKKIFIDFNPVRSFYAHELINDKENVSFHISTYKDNPFIPDEIVKSIESRRSRNPSWFRVYGEGQIGSVEGLIIPDFELIDVIPHIDTVIGIDFGYNDPTSCIELGIQGDNAYINELFYGRGMTNQLIVKHLTDKKVPKDYLMYADCAEPKSIAEIRTAGYTNIKPCVKGADSFLFGIDYLKRYKIHVTKNSTSVIKDFRNASWEQDIDGNFINVAQGGFLHAIDSVRYALNRWIRPPSTGYSGRI